LRAPLRNSPASRTPAQQRNFDIAEEAVIQLKDDERTVLQDFLLCGPLKVGPYRSREIQGIDRRAIDCLLSTLVGKGLLTRDLVGAGFRAETAYSVPERLRAPLEELLSRR
jgi:hypothetical protein